MKLPLYKSRMGLLARMIGASVPVLNRFRKPGPFPYQLNELRVFPAGSLGAETARFLDARHFDFLPQYETHDVFHTLLGYGTSTIGELRLQAFMWGNHSSSLAGRVLFVLGLMLAPELWLQLQKDIERGRRSIRVADLDIPRLLIHPLENLRPGLLPDTTEY
jgi:ubiquinone biosynthesis protein Coq4